MGAPPVAESSDLSEWPRSARDEGENAEDIRRAPQQERWLAEGKTDEGKNLPLGGERCER